METHSVQHSGGITILEVRGAVIADKDVELLRKSVATLIENESKKLLIDLHAMNRMNSSGIGVLVGAHTSYARRGWQLRFCGIATDVHLLLAITNLRKVFHIDETRDAALAKFGGSEVGAREHRIHTHGGGES